MTAGVLSRILSKSPNGKLVLPCDVSKPVRRTTARQPPSGVRMEAFLSSVCCSTLVPLKSTKFLSRLMFRCSFGSTCNKIRLSRQHRVCSHAQRLQHSNSGQVHPVHALRPPLGSQICSHQRSLSCDQLLHAS